FVNPYVCVSESSTRVAQEEGIARARLRTVPNGIDLTRFPFRGPNRAGPAVLVARLSPEKDIATLLRATAIVVRHRPDFRLEIAGHGPCFDDLRALAEDLGLAGNVAFLGDVRDVAGLLAGASCFVLSS